MRVALFVIQISVFFFPQLLHLIHKLNFQIPNPLLFCFLLSPILLPPLQLAISLRPNNHLPNHIHHLQLSILFSSVSLLLLPLLYLTLLLFFLSQLTPPLFFLLPVSFLPFSVLLSWANDGIPVVVGTRRNLEAARQTSVKFTHSGSNSLF